MLVALSADTLVTVKVAVVVPLADAEVEVVASVLLRVDVPVWEAVTVLVPERVLVSVLVPV